MVGWYVVKIDDPSQAPQMAAKLDCDVRELAGGDQDDDRERRSSQGFAKQIGDIGAIMVAILVAVLFTFCWSPPTRWRSRCASAPASWPC